MEFHKVKFLVHSFSVFFLNYLLKISINPLNAELNPICHLLALLGAHHILHVSRIRVKNTKLVLYADDTSVIVTYPSHKDFKLT
jgi:hypothetical protein